jgi:RimJ/RimL family protein N-acetyltransferase
VRERPPVEDPGVLECRQVGPADAKILGALLTSLDASTFHPHPLTFEEADRIAAHRGRDVYAILLEDGRPIGYGMLRGWDEGYATPSLGVALDPGAQGRGLSRTLMEYLHAVAWGRGAPSIRLRVHPDNTRARRLYESMGYRVTGEERGELVMLLDRHGEA